MKGGMLLVLHMPGQNHFVYRDPHDAGFGLQHLVCWPKAFGLPAIFLHLQPGYPAYALLVLKACTIGISILAPAQVRWPIIAGDRLALCLSFCEIASCYFFALLGNHLLLCPCRSHRSQIGQLAAFTITTANLWDVLFREAWLTSYIVVQLIIMNYSFYPSCPALLMAKPAYSQFLHSMHLSFDARGRSWADVAEAWQQPRHIDFESFFPQRVFSLACFAIFCNQFR